MTTILFLGWLQRFQDYVARTPGCNVVMSMDKFCAKSNLLVLSNVKDIFLLLNCTSKVQPMYAGIIASLNVRYRNFHMERALDNINSDVKDIKKLIY